MRPIKLTICGINSYVSEQSVDFNKLSKGSLFGIFGATGSGKSTILDCIIIALYGTSDRDNLTNIINVNVKDAYIKFEFELEGKGGIFQVTRNFKLRPSGLTSGAELINKTNNLMLGDTTEKVNFELEKMLGISKREFLKCIALPQNEFDKFLLDTPADRKKSISKLFNLENFGENLNNKVKERLNVLNVKNLTLEEQLKGFGNLNETTQKQLSNEIKLNKKIILTTEKQIKDLQFELKELDAKYNTSKKLDDTKRQLSDIKSREEYYLKLKFELETFNSNKEKLNLINELRNKIVMLDDVNQKFSSVGLELKYNEENLNKTNNEIGELKEKQELLNAKLNLFKLSLEKKRVLSDEIENIEYELKTLKDKHSAKLDELLIVSEHEEKVEKNLNAVLNDIKNVNDEIKNNDKILKKISDAILLSESEGFIEKLNDLKYGINQTNLDQVEEYRIHKDILTLIAKINKYVASYQTKLNKRDLILSDLQVALENLPNINKEFIKKQNELNTNLNQLNKKHSDYYALKSSYVVDENNIQKEIENLKESILNKNEKLKNLKEQIKEFDELTDCSNELNNVINNLEKCDIKKVELMETISKNNAMLKALDVEKKYLNEQINNLKQNIPDNFNVATLQNEINENNYSNYVNDLNNYEKQKNYFETLLENLNNELNGEPINTKMVETKKESLNKLQQSLNELKVKVGIDETNYNNNVKLLIKQNELETELHSVHNDLKLMQKLASYLSKNALVDFVSEEYLYLITQYANKFVYKISRGKYMLKYSSKNAGEFIAVDNFNGGIERSIKTLSGGERFIFSLGLALGVSQSISVNNNKTFNFFFIDEGFGNLSEDYIDDVLNCFDSLIKLDFTVGFITHVDKMQEYIANKVVVTKDNNETGSIITQF